MTAAETLPGLDDPGYLRYCAVPLCDAAFHALRGPAAGWLTGRAGPIGTSYFCPGHGPLIRAHIPRWVQGPVTGTLCACGWGWQPAAQSPLGDHLLAWLLHLGEDGP